MKKYCLIGEKLSHSYSPFIYREFGLDYSLKEIKPEQFASFVVSKEYAGFNVTIPYKKSIIPFLNGIDPVAEAVGAVNTVKHINKACILGYNTDVAGMDYLIGNTGVKLENKKVLILGTGGTSRTAAYLAKEKKAAKTVIVGRSGADNYNNLSLHYDAEIIINTTPVGMYPGNGQKIINLSPFEKLEGVFDAIYNPLFTDLVLQAKQRKIPSAGGLKMLVSQAIQAFNIFTGVEKSSVFIKEIYNKLYKKIANVILIGMPSCGKTTIGKLLAEKTGKAFTDTDAEIEKAEKMTVAEIFKTKGESYFRSLEKEALEKYGKENGQIISVGGGAVMGENAYAALKQNGIIVRLTRDLEKTDTFGRPLLKKAGALNELYEKRMPIYKAFADITVDNNGDAEQTVFELRRKLNEYTCD